MKFELDFDLVLSLSLFPYSFWKMCQILWSKMRVSINISSTFVLYWVFLCGGDMQQAGLLCVHGWMNLYDNCTPICFMFISLKEIILSLYCHTSSTIKFEEWTLPRIFVRTSWFIANLSLCMQNVFSMRKLNNEKYSCLQFEKPISHIFRRPNLFDCFKVER